MEVKKEKISWTETIANKTFQIQTDADVIVPDTKPDIRKILQVDAHARMTSHELQSDRIIVNGMVKYNIVYMPDDDTKQPHCIITQMPFTDVVSFNGIEPRMQGELEAEIVGVNYRIINGRKFSVKSMVEVVAKISKTEDIECVCSIDDDSVQVKNEEAEYLVRSAECEKVFTVNEKIVVPQSETAIGEVLKVTPKISEYTTKVISNKIILKGEVQLTCTYADASENEIISVNNIIPFTEILDVDGVKADDICNVKIIVADYNYNCEENADGEIRSLEVQSEIVAKVTALREEKINILCDCYATCCEVNLKTKMINLPQKITDVEYQDTFKAQIEVEDDEPEISRIYDVFSKGYIDEIEQADDRLNIRGSVDSYILYATGDEDVPIYCARNEIDFSESFDCEGQHFAKGDFSARVLNASYVLNDSKNVELRVNVKVDGLIYSNSKKTVITEITAEELAAKPDIASITVYFVQENDTLWEIAKRYLTTIDAIKSVNDGIDDNLQKGMQLLIPKYKAYK